MTLSEKEIEAFEVRNISHYDFCNLLISHKELSNLIAEQAKRIEELEGQIAKSKPRQTDQFLKFLNEGQCKSNFL